MVKSAAIYTRISSDDGLALGVARQEKDCRQLAKRLGWTVFGVYSDNDTSAFSGKTRPRYERMLADLEAGLCDAVVCWDVDRLTRTPIELEYVIALAERLGLGLASVGGEIDLGTPQGRLTARIKASVARHEVEQSSRRIRRKTLERAEQGQPHGRAAFGWRRELIHDGDGRRVGARDVIVPEEAAVVQEIAQRVAAGESVRSIAQSLELRGVPAPNGSTRWHPVTLRQVVMRDRNAGLRIHQKNVIGAGNWEPILSTELFERVCAILRNPERRSASSTTTRHLLSGLAVCGLCGGPMRSLATYRSRPRAYACSACFKIRRRQGDVDRLVTELVVRRLSMPDAAAALTMSGDSDIRTYLEQLGDLRGRLDIAADQFASGAIDGAQLARITARLRPKLDVATAKVREASAAPDLLDLADPNIAARWQDLPIERKRAVIDALVTVTIKPIGKTGRIEFDPEGVQVQWKRP